MRIMYWSSDVCSSDREGRARRGDDLAAAGDRLTLSTALGFSDADYKEYVTNIGGVPTDVADYREVQNTPKWTASGTLDYSVPAGDGDLGFRTTLSYRDRKSTRLNSSH